MTNFSNKGFELEAILEQVVDFMGRFELNKKLETSLFFLLKGLVNKSKDELKLKVKDIFKEFLIPRVDHSDEILQTMVRGTLMTTSIVFKNEAECFDLVADKFPLKSNLQAKEFYNSFLKNICAKVPLLEEERKDKTKEIVAIIKKEHEVKGLLNEVTLELLRQAVTILEEQ